MKCPEFGELMDLVENRLNPIARKKLEAHVTECGKCAETKAWAERVFPAMKASAHLYDAPEYAIRNAIGIFERRKPALKDWIFAKLDFDSWLSPAMAGTRSASSGPRQLRYETDAYSIHLMLDPAGPRRARVTGHLIANHPEAVATHCLVEVADSKSVLAQTLTGDHGEFLVEVPGGRKLEIKIHGEPESVRLSCRF